MERKQYNQNKKYECLPVNRFGNGSHITLYKELIGQDVLVVYDLNTIKKIKDFVNKKEGD
jgi:hypothetical protein